MWFFEKILLVNKFELVGRFGTFQLVKKQEQPPDDWIMKC